MPFDSSGLRVSTALQPITRATLLPHLREPWPLPAQGQTGQRWGLIAALARQDLPLVKLVEPHHDAAAILADLGGPPIQPDEVWAVWAAEPPFAVLEARQRAEGWTLSGQKAFCSGATIVTHALVTARAAHGSQLFAIDLAQSGLSIDSSAPPWVGPGMARADTRTLILADVPASPVGGPGDYTDRPGFWWGAIGIAAAWFGGARSVCDQIEARHLDAHGLAHLGATRADLDTMELALEAAARRADRQALAVPQVERLAQSLRARAADLAEQSLIRAGHVLGPGPLAFNPQHSARVADLQMFVRQHHAEQDLARLGMLGAEDV